MNTAPNRSVAWIISCILVLGTLAAYRATRQFEFNNFDDQAFVSQNRIVQAGLTWNGVVWAFTTSYADYWHPLAWLSHMLDCQLFGLNAGAHHLINVLWHTANAVLLFLVLRRMTSALWPSAIVAGFFAWHPLRVESVAWVAERKDVLCAFFWVLTLWAYARYVERRGTGRYLMVLASFSLALTSKAMAVTLPFVLLLLDYWPLSRFRFSPAVRLGPALAIESTRAVSVPRPSTRWLLMEKLPLLLLSVATCVTILLAQRQAEPAQWSNLFPVTRRLANALVSYTRYLGKTISPEDLNILYVHPGTWPTWQVVSAGLVLLLISTSLLLVARRFPFLIVGWLWFLGTLVPVLGLVQIGPQAMADRFSYLPSIGLLIMIVWGVAQLASFRPELKKPLILAVAVALLACWIGTVRQVQTWRNSEMIWRRALQADPANPYAHNNLGDVLLRAHRNDEALVHFYQAIELKPEMYSSHNNIGLALCMAGNVREGTNHYALALRYKPDYDAAHFNYGFILSSLGNVDEAIAHYEAALRVSPQHSMARTWLGNALLAKGRTNEALAQLAEAIRVSPEYAEGHYYLGRALASQRETAKALFHLNEAVRLNPQPAMLNSLAWLLATDPDSRFRNGNKAVELARQACELSSFQNPGFVATLAAAHAEAGQLDEAVRFGRQACDIATATGQTNLAQAQAVLLRLYEKHQAYRGPPL
jgi:tetratricopeptide (TPR) repeat protein